MRQVTYINDETYWFFYCSSNEFDTTLYGPFDDEDSCKKEANTNKCTNAHFLTQFVPPHLEIRVLEDIPYSQTMFDWIEHHNEEARKNPLYRNPFWTCAPYNDFTDGVTDYDTMIKDAFSHG